MIPLIWSPQALRDIESIRAYIADDSPIYAELVVGRILKAVERLTAFPESGRIVPERNSTEIREVIVAPYRVVYRVRAGTVEVVTSGGSGFHPAAGLQIASSAQPMGVSARSSRLRSAA